MAGRSFSPENTQNVLYVYSNGGYSLDDLIDAAKHYFSPDVDIADIVITSEYIHTRCIDYDRYDASDYDNYVVMTLTNNKE